MNELDTISQQNIETPLDEYYEIIKQWTKNIGLPLELVSELEHEYRTEWKYRFA